MSGLHEPDLDLSAVVAPAVDVIHKGVAWSTSITEAWDPAILTLDGGGIRGYSSLLILKALMHEIAVIEKRFDKEEEQARKTSPGTAGPLHDTLVVPLTQDGDIRGSENIAPRSSSLRRDSGSPAFLSPQGIEKPKTGDSGTGGNPFNSPLYPQSLASSFDIPAVGPAEALEPPDPLQATDSTPEGMSEFEDNLLPSHYFDFIYGTSTGGLIATMLGRLRMSVPQCLKIYREVSDGLFGRRRTNLPLRTKYYAEPLEKVVKEIVAQHCKQHGSECDGLDWHPWYAAYNGTEGTAGADFDRHICQSICLTAVHNGKIDMAHLLRTNNVQYDNIPNWTTPYNQGADMLKIWQVTRATSAAPFYFKALQAELEGELWSFKDGGIRENNPSGAAFSEFVSMFGENKDPALLLSVGTGRPNEERDGFAAAWPGPLGNSRFLKKWAEKFAVLKNVLVKYTAGEEKHKQMLNTARGEHTWYKRLNVSEGLETLRLDDWKRGPWTDPTTGVESVVPGGTTLTLIEEATKAYLARDLDLRFDTYAKPTVMLQQVAEKLVRQRRARAALTSDEDRKRWDTYVGKYLTGRYRPEAEMPGDTTPTAR